MTNNLLNTQSLYLRKHAYNPINWHFWGEKALNLAKSENKPIFLSIGYSSCHWCTVMEGEAFSNEAIAEYLNKYFVAIKVDREERPDIDSIYMTALQMMTGQGGWPLNIFLSPDDLVPFYGGTYFPIEPRYGRPGFLQILQSLHDFYHQQQDKLTALKSEIVKGLTSNSQIIFTPNSQLTPELLSQGIENNSKVIARNDYGSPRFPMMPYTNLTLQGSISNSDCHDLAIKRGIDLVNGGIYDHVGGGFHRYTVDASWTVPHFEKMLYDNGLIMEFLANLWSSGVEKPEIKLSCEGILSWLKREMTADEGYFYASQDADNFTNINDIEPEEGDFYVWDYQQLKEILSEEEFKAFEDTFIISERGNFEGKNVLQKKEEKPITTLIENALEKLFLIRYGDNSASLTKFTPAKNNQEVKSIHWQGRIPTVTDTKMILSWNSLMISGLARAYSVFRDKNYLDLAKKATNFILTNQWQNDRLYRLNYEGKVRILAQAEDYAFFIKALLDLSQYSDNNYNYYLTQAIKVQQEFDLYCGDTKDGGYYNNANDNCADLLLKEKSYIDNATPSANGIAITNLVRLGLLTDNLEYLEKAEQILKLFSDIMAKSSVSCPSLFVALNWYLQGTSVKTTPEIKSQIEQKYLPTTVSRITENLPSNTIGIVCHGLFCFEPVINIDQLLKLLQNLSHE
ncbi:thioredoxin domain-containing protein [Geminocystis sp. GBBB08]|uniref:thioredoxin domain-containing protein n=1 Tax=Geminocystis sp. GBBB08 TaxID=2604140 RepID=UPI0027E29298|nr:thioredoxin domain-containing protein [Geminocystis sp. GBBB08]MBL1209572.1 thioredoxin domain-containing protein [Geminocystis sp. GBBB08]